MYKYVLPYAESFGPGYYGVSGTNWDEPPILKNPSDTRTINGREYLLFYEQDKLRLVGWQTSKGSYWVINTLTHALTEAQMLGSQRPRASSANSFRRPWTLSVNR